MISGNLRSRRDTSPLEMYNGGRLPSASPPLASPPQPIDFALSSPDMFTVQSLPGMATSPIPIRGSDAGTKRPAMFRSASARHQPYPTSPASASDRSTSHSFASHGEMSGWESESSACSADIYGSSVESRDTSPSTSSEVSQSVPVEASPFVVGVRTKKGKDGKPAKSHTRRLDPGYIKRPPNAFILFRSHCCAPERKGEDAQKPDPPGTAHARHLASLQLSNSQHVSVIVSQVWKSLSADERAYWEEKARLAKEEHRRLHPDYRFSPKQRPKDPRRRQLVSDPQRKEERQACTEVARQVLQLEGITLAEADEEDSPTSASSRKAPRANSRKKRRAPKQTCAPADSKGVPASKPMAAYEGAFPVDSIAVGCPVAASTPEMMGSGSESDYTLASLLDTPETWTCSLFGPPPAGQFEPMVTLTVTPSVGYEHDGFAIDPRLASAGVSPSGNQLQLDMGYRHEIPSVTSSLLTPPQTAPTSTFVLPNPSASPRRVDLPSDRGETPFASYGLPTPAIEFNPASPFSPRGGCVPLPSPPASTIAERRYGPVPGALLSEALQRRRSTVKPPNSHAARGDLMLISPVVTTKDGRRQSLGFDAGLRRFSGASRTAPDDDFPTPRASVCYPRGSISAGVLSATETFETFTFPQSVLESLPAEDLGSFGLLEPFADGSPAGSETALRPSTAGSVWSDHSDHRMVGHVDPASLLARRRSTVVPIGFASPYGATTGSSDAGAGSHYGYHVGSTDLFESPAAAIPGGLTYGASSPEKRDCALLPPFGTFEPLQVSPDLQAGADPALLQSIFPPFDYSACASSPAIPDVPVNVVSADDAWFSTPAYKPSASDLRDASLSLLEDRHRAEGGQYDSFDHSTAPPRMETADPEPECQYVYLTLDQLEDTELMTRIHEQGYGIAFDAGSLENSPEATVSNNMN
ncbi:hypothetical protein JCM3774_000305 [Rhodotorula dairenensis]